MSRLKNLVQGNAGGLAVFPILAGSSYEGNYLCSWTPQWLLPPSPHCTSTTPPSTLDVTLAYRALNALAVTLENPAKPGGSVSFYRLAGCHDCHAPPGPRRHAQWLVHTWFSFPASRRASPGGGTTQPLSLSSSHTLILLSSASTS